MKGCLQQYFSPILKLSSWACPAQLFIETYTPETQIIKAYFEKKSPVKLKNVSCIPLLQDQ